MSILLIESNPVYKRPRIKDQPFLTVSEFFIDTVQGENFVGIPSSFLRLTGCTLDCIWCDTTEVWRYGNDYTFDELFKLLEDSGAIERYRGGQHLILTGGSPLKQQKNLILFIEDFIQKYGFKPYIEIENEAVLYPEQKLIDLVDCWNNSPKLENSEMKLRARYKEDILRFTSKLKNSWFKFVVASEQDWNEIKKYFLDTNICTKDQLVLMPEGQTREQLQEHYEIVVKICIEQNVRMCDRFHVTIWDKKTGV